jgi:hypothetical protein
LLPSDRDARRETWLLNPPMKAAELTREFRLRHASSSFQKRDGE